MATFTPSAPSEDSAMRRLLLYLFLFGLSASFARGESPPALKIHFIGVGEYEPAKSLAEFQKHLEQTYRVECTASLGGNGKKLENLDPLKSADLLVIFARRRNCRDTQ